MLVTSELLLIASLRLIKTTSTTTYSWDICDKCLGYAYVWDMFEIYLRYLWDMSNICLRYDSDMPEIYLSYVKDMPSIYL